MTKLSGSVTTRAPGHSYLVSMPKSDRSGFTLIEMLIVLSLVGILAALALPRLRAASFDADTGMRTVQSALQQAQRAAIVRQTEVMVSFDTANKRVRIVYDVNNNHQYDVGEEIHWRPLEPGDRFVIPPVGVQMTASAPIVGNALATRDNFPTIFYHRDGAVSSELELYLTSNRASLDDIRALHMRQATGRVQTYRYNGSTWIGAGL
ncbi:MAG: prepilin-type N-terminal cleavage/methylation domain-containing protein [Gemmatimonadota bacterium]|nr:prepilin-type N-terminal cleavage/methylation domain-containing protein [Gemmatimonadota bacterium]